MQLFLLLLTLGCSLLGSVASAAEGRSCTDPSTRAEVKAGVQERLGSLGMPRNIEALALLSRLGDARSDVARQLAAVFQQKSGLRHRPSSCAR